MSRLALGHTHLRNHHYYHVIIVIIGLVQHFKVIIEISNLSKSKQDHSTLSKRMLKWLCSESWLLFVSWLQCILQLVVQI